MGWKTAMADKEAEFRKIIENLTTDKVIRQLSLKGALRFQDEEFGTAEKKKTVETAKDLLSWEAVKEKALRYKTGAKAGPKKVLTRSIMLRAEEQGLLTAELAVAVASAQTQGDLKAIAKKFGIED